MPNPAARFRPSRTTFVWLLLAVIMVTAVIIWRTRAVEADAIEVKTQPLRRSLQFSARVETPARVEIGSTVTGRVARVRVREGAMVAAGAPLIELESAELSATLNQTVANLRQAQARLVSQEVVGRAGADAGLLQAEATLAAAERELVRTRELLAANFISRARLDEVQRAVDVARAQRDAARAQVQGNRRGGPESASLLSQQQAAQAAAEAARARLDQTTLRAPAAGKIIARAVEPGQIVQAGRALLTLAIVGPTELVALVDERFLGQLQVGQRAQVLADAYPLQPFDARLARLAPAVDAQRGAVEVIFTIEGTVPAFLREDMTLSIETITGERPAALVLPLRALRIDPSNPQRAVVLVQEGERARAKAITLGLRTLNQVEVTGGLASGAVVLLDSNLSPDGRVRARLLDAAQFSRDAATGKNSGAADLTNAMSGGISR